MEEVVTAPQSSQRILEHLRATSDALTSGRPLEGILNTLLVAVRDLGFDGARFDLISADGRFLSTAVARGSRVAVLKQAPAECVPKLEEPHAPAAMRCCAASGETPEHGLVPLLSGGDVTGWLYVDNAESGRPILLEDLEPLTLFAHQAASAVSNARLRETTRRFEALRKTTLAVTSARDRESLLTTIIEQAVQLLEAKNGGIYRRQPELGTLTIIADLRRADNLGKTLELGQGMAGKLVESGEPWMIVENYETWPGKADIFTGRHRFGAVLEVPLRWKEDVLGVLYIDDDTGRVFSEDEACLLSLFADQAAISLANSDQTASGSQKLQRLERLALSSQKMMSDLAEMELPDRLSLIAQHAKEILDAEACGVFLVRGEEISLEGSFGQKTTFVPGARRMKIRGGDRQGLTGFIANSFVQGEKIFKAYGETLQRHPAAAHHEEPHTPSACYSLLAVPLRRRMGDTEDLVGLLRIDNKKGEGQRALATLGFNQEDEWILAIFAEAAVVAIESAELVDRLKLREDFQQRLIASSPNGIIAVNERGKINVFNRRAEETLGYTREEVLGKPVHPLYSDPKEPRRIGDMLDESPEHRVLDHRTFVRSKEGEAIPILHSSTWIYDTKNRRIGSVGYFEDLRPQEAIQNRERLLLEASSVIAQPRALGEGLETLAAKMVSLLKRSFCGILLKDDNRDFLIVRAVNIAGRPGWRPRRDQPIALADFPGLREILESGDPTVRKWADDRARPNLQNLSRLLELETDIRYLLVVPLKIGSRVVGQIDLGELNESPHADFDQEEIDLIAAIGAQITVLLHRLRLLEVTEHREALLKKLIQVSTHVRADMDLPTLTQSITRLGAELVNAQVGALFPYLSRIGEVGLPKVHGPLEEVASEVPSGSLIDRVASSGEAQTAADVAADPLLTEWGLSRAAAVPLQQASGEVEAVLMVGDPAPGLPQFSQDDLEVLRLFANQASSTLLISDLIDGERRTTSKLGLLHRISDYIQTIDDLGKILHAVLTGVTASYGLRFNRAALLLLDETGEALVGRMGIGEVVETRARAVWKNDDAQGLDNFARYLEWIAQQKERAEQLTTVGRRVARMTLPVGGDDAFSEVIRTGKCQRIEPDQLSRVPAAFVQELKVKSTLAVAPLLARREVIGILVADNKITETPIGNDDLDSLMAFAATAAIALENKQLLDQTRIGSQTLLSFYAANSELTKINDPRQILQTSVEQTLAASGASWVSILLIDELGRVSNPIAKGRAFVPQGQELVRPHGISMQVMRSGQAIPIEDVGKSLDRVNPSMVAAGAQAALCLPLSLPGKRIGVMWIHYAERRRFPELEVAALQLYVNQAATAYDNARRIERLESLREAFDALASAADTTSVLEQIVHCARRVLRSQAAILWAYDEKRDTFILESSVYSGPDQQAWAKLHQEGPHPRGTAYTIMRRGWVTIGDVRNPAQNQLLGDATREFLETTGGSSLLGVALRVGDERLGVLYAIYSDTTLFGEEERAAATTFANHAALAWKKAKLLDQVKRLNRATDAVARVTVLGDRKTALKAIAQETMEAVDCSAVVLFEYDRRAGALIHPPTMVGVLDEEAATSPAETAEYPLVLAMMEQDRPHVVEPITADPRFATRFAREEKIQSCAAVALKTAERKVGVLFVNYRDQHRFTQDELTNVEMFANLAAVALYNAQLFDDLSRKLREQSALADLSHALLGTTDFQETMDHAVATAAEALETELANIVLLDDRDRLIFSAGYGWEKELVGRYELQKGDGSQAGYTIQQGHAIPVDDYRSVDFQVPSLIADHAIQSGLSVPLFLNGRIVGAMLVHSRRLRRFSKDDENLLRLIADDTALAIQGARQLEERQRILSRLTTQGALAEMFSDHASWHHDLTHAASAIELRLENLRRDLGETAVSDPVADDLRVLEEKVRAAREILNETRVAVSSERTLVPLVDLLQRCIDLQRERLGGRTVEIRLVPDGLTGGDRVHAQEARLAKVFENLIDNAVKATLGLPRRGKVEVVGRKLGRTAEISVIDNGCGIPEEIRKSLNLMLPIDKPPGGRDTGMGLLIARTIVQSYDGDLRCVSWSPGTTTFMVSLPLSEAGRDEEKEP
jgi:PAS domain S-box-containing protein